MFLRLEISYQWNERQAIKSSDSDPFDYAFMLAL